MGCSDFLWDVLIKSLAGRPPLGIEMGSHLQKQDSTKEEDKVIEEENYITIGINFGEQSPLLLNNKEKQGLRDSFDFRGKDDIGYLHEFSDMSRGF